MGSVDIAVRSAALRLEASENDRELYAVEHDEVTRLYRFEDHLAGILKLYREIQAIDARMIATVDGHPELFDDALDQLVVAMCERIHQLLEWVHQVPFRHYEAKYGDVQNKAELMSALEASRENAKYGYRRKSHVECEAITDEIMSMLTTGRDG